MSSPGEAIQRYILGYHAKTKRSLAEEAECGDETSVCSWVRDGHDPNEADSYGYTPLLNAAALGRCNAVEELIKNGADINKAGPFGFAPIHAAAQCGHREVVALLMKYGANINAQNEDLDTPMHLALRSHHMEIVFILVRNGGDASIQGFQSKNSIETAKQMGLVDLSDRLKNYNVSIGLSHPRAASYPELKRK
jgi:cytohesin